jgi:hypothetical protein
MSPSTSKETRRPDEPCHDAPYTAEELTAHHALYPQGQFVAEHTPTGQAVGVHFTLRLRMADYHVDDAWDVLTACGKPRH